MGLDLVKDVLEEENVRLWLVDFVMFPSKTLSKLLALSHMYAEANQQARLQGRASYLGDAESSPFVFP